MKDQFCACGRGPLTAKRAIHCSSKCRTDAWALKRVAALIKEGHSEALALVLRVQQPVSGKTPT